MALNHYRGREDDEPQEGVRLDHVRVRRPAEHDREPPSEHAEEAGRERPLDPVEVGLLLLGADPFGLGAGT
ncbi:MAG TPA: hypothetical protein HA263_10135 [Methanoregulaceae archaeon]|nr:hypothetical protein [Methanoregulaceae archaeon]